MRKLFVIMPFGIHSDVSDPDRSPINFDAVYETVIKPAGLAADFSVLRIDEVATPGRISDQYLQELFTADVVVADVSVPNPNVFYELGIRQAMGTGPTVLIADRPHNLPFDIREQRVLFYNLTAPTQLLQARANLSRVLREATESTGKNPIQRFLYSIGASTNPAEDKAAFDQDFRGRIERARNANQLIAVWSWAQQYKSLPAFTLTFLANRLADEKEWAIAKDVIRLALKVRPTDFELHRYHGWYLRNLGEAYYTEAEAAFRKALRLNGSDPETIGMLAGLLKRQGRFAEASELYRQGALLAPANHYMKINGAAMELLANPQSPKGADSLYRSMLQELLTVAPDERDAWTEVLCAEAYFVLGDDEASRRHFEAAARTAGSPTVLRSPADQIELFGAHGFRTESAKQLSSWVRSLIKEPLVPPLPPQVNPTAKTSVSPSNPVIIHLTDVHFGSKPGMDGKPVRMHRFFDGDDSQTLEDHLLREFKSTKRHFFLDGRPAVLVVSGDFTYTATSGEFTEALQFLEKLCSGLSISKDRVIVCPGNHDVNWAHSKIDKTHRFDQYISFLAKFYGDTFRTRYPLIKWDLTVDGARPRATDLLSLQVLPKDHLLILSLNSCVYETEEHHYGYVSGRQLRNFEELLEREDIDNNLVRIAVVHHHLHPFPEPVKLEVSGEHWQDQSTIRDSALVEKYLEKHGFDIVLHGHKHKPQLRETLVRDPSFSMATRPLIVLGGGSCGVESRELEHNVPNQYEVLELVNVPRVRGADFLRVEWRTLDVAPG
jgi:3',5'-cyclic AMP phosphodiesterase CpdA/tetratricopeptide (TPR) repeat protein